MLLPNVTVENKMRAHIKKKQKFMKISMILFRNLLSLVATEA